MTDRFRERRPVGLEYLEAATELLQAARLSHPTAGVWEAADLQWWWRRDQHGDEERQRFFYEAGRPVGAVVLSEEGDSRQCDLLRVDTTDAWLTEFLFEVALEMLAEFSDLPVDLFVRHDDEVLARLAADAGFSGPDWDMTAWLEAGARPPVPELREGFFLASRAELDGPHHLARRNGPEVAARLAECSLYRPELDLAVLRKEGEVAAYGLFWADPVTGVGLVEPIRTEDGYKQMGLAAHVVASGLDRLARSGCSRLKVSFDPENVAAERLYLGRGFVPFNKTAMLRRPAG